MCNVDLAAGRAEPSLAACLRCPVLSKAALTLQVKLVGPYLSCEIAVHIQAPFLVLDRWDKLLASSPTLCLNKDRIAQTSIRCCMLSSLK